MVNIIYVHIVLIYSVIQFSFIYRCNKTILVVYISTIKLQVYRNKNYLKSIVCSLALLHTD